MSRTRRWNNQATVGVILIVLGLALLVALLVLAVPKTGALHPGAPSRSSGQASGATLGERIFQTGRDAIGQVIPRSGVTGMMGTAVACADCHGSDARGRTIQMMMGQIQAPDIRWSTLAAPPTQPGDKAFDPSSFFLAVTQGLDPNGSTLKAFMPRWQLTRAQTDALIDYLDTL